jgi:hypothetical protein
MQVNPSNFAAPDIAASVFSGKATLSVARNQGVLHHELGPPNTRPKLRAAARYLVGTAIDKMTHGISLSA